MVVIVVVVIVVVVVVAGTVLCIVFVKQKFFKRRFEAVSRGCSDNVVRDIIPNSRANNLQSFFTIIIVTAPNVELESRLDYSNVKMMSLLYLSSHSCAMIMNFMLKDKPVVENRWAIKVQG